MKKKVLLFLPLLVFALTYCSEKKEQKIKQDSYKDISFMQDYSIKFDLATKDITPIKVYADRNGNIDILTENGLLRPRAGKFLFPGTLVKDVYYRPIADKKIAGITLYKNQFVYVDDKAVLSNAWAGKLFSRHTMPDAKILCGGKNFAFLISNGEEIIYLKNSETLWEDKADSRVLDIKYDEKNDVFWILKANAVSTFSSSAKELKNVFQYDSLTAIAVFNDKIILGTPNGYLELEASTGKQTGDIQRKLPCTNLTAVTVIDGKLWFGSKHGAFMLRDNGKFNYYASKRWLPDDEVIHIAKGPDSSVLVLTSTGLGVIHFEEMNLHDKAVFFEKQVQIIGWCQIQEQPMTVVSLPCRQDSGPTKGTSFIWALMHLSGVL